MLTSNDVEFSVAFSMYVKDLSDDDHLPFPIFLLQQIASDLVPFLMISENMQFHLAQLFLIQKFLYEKYGIHKWNSKILTIPEFNLHMIANLTRILHSH